MDGKLDLTAVNADITTATIGALDAKVENLTSTDLLDVAGDAIITATGDVTAKTLNVGGKLNLSAVNVTITTAEVTENATIIATGDATVGDVTVGQNLSITAENLVLNTLTAAEITLKADAITDTTPTGQISIQTQKLTVEADTFGTAENAITTKLTGAAQLLMKITDALYLEDHSDEVVIEQMDTDTADVVVSFTGDVTSNVDIAGKSVAMTIGGIAILKDIQSETDVTIDVADFAEIGSITAGGNVQIRGEGDVIVADVEAINLVLIVHGTAELEDVKVVGHVQLDAVGRLMVSSIDSNSMMLTAGSSLTAGKLSSYGPVEISAVNVYLTTVEGYTVDVTVDDVLLFQKLFATVDVTILSNGQVVSAADSSITSMYGDILVDAKGGYKSESGATLAADGKVEISAGGNAIVMNAAVNAQKLVLTDAKDVTAVLDQTANEVIITTKVDDATVNLDVTAAENLNVKLDMAGKNDTLNLTSGVDNNRFLVKADSITLEQQGMIQVSGLENAVINSTGKEAIVDIYEMPCTMTVNTNQGDDVINVGILLETKPEGITAVQVDEGWLTVGTNHALTVNTGSGIDRINANSIVEELIFAGGSEEDTLYITEYSYADKFDRYPIGSFGAYEDVENVIIERLVDMYEVVDGDNLYDIGERFGVTVEQLVEWNGEWITDPDLIYTGQQFYIGPYKTELEIVTDRIGA